MNLGEHAEWVSTLKPGDTVALRSGHGDWKNTKWVECRVLITDNPGYIHLYHKCDGSYSYVTEIGGTYLTETIFDRIYPFDECKFAFEYKKLIKKIDSFSWKDLTMDQLKEIEKIIDNKLPYEETLKEFK